MMVCECTNCTNQNCTNQYNCTIINNFKIGTMIVIINVQIQVVLPKMNLTSFFSSVSINSFQVKGLDVDTSCVAHFLTALLPQSCENYSKSAWSTPKCIPIRHHLCPTCWAMKFLPLQLLHINLGHIKEHRCSYKYVTCI